jgi:uncharacterized protein involved in exopolysaccharide biosynthesis
VIGRFFDTFFRHKLLILMPIVLIPLIVTPIAFWFNRPYYETYVGVWVDRPSFVRPSDSWNQYITPAQNQNNELVDLLRTRAFRSDIARRTSLRPFVGSVAGDEQIRIYFDRNLATIPTGRNILTIRGRGDTPQIAVQLANAVVEAFRDRVVSDQLNQASATIAFYEGQFKEADEKMTTANNALRRYVAANPRLSTIDPTRGAAATTASRLGLPPIAIDPQLAELIRQVEAAQGDADRLRELLERARFEASASQEGQQTGFQVVDPAPTPTAPIVERRRLMVYPAAALAAGLAIGAALLVILFVSDRSARSIRDLGPDLRVLGTIPQLQVKKLPKKGGSHAARRAIGYVAGAALPAPKGAG